MKHLGHTHSKTLIAALMATVGILLGGVSQAQLTNTMPSNQRPQEFDGVGITEQLGANLDLQEQVHDETGKLVPLQTFFKDHRPVILSLVYFNCPGLCNLHLNGLIDGLKQLPWSPGKEFEVVALSFDAREDADATLAQKKKNNYMREYDRPGTESGFHFVTADKATIARITSQAGFKFKWDDKDKQWSHASAAILVTPQGKIARYLHGILFDVPTLKLALNDAGAGKVGTFIDQMVWYCSHYDPTLSRYTLMASKVMRLGGVLIILVLGAILVPVWLRSRRRQA